MNQMTKSEHILSLNDGKRTTREIADAVYGGRATRKQMAYTRVVLKQRRGAGLSENDRRYRESPLGQIKRRQNSAANKASYNTGNREKARAAGRRAYRKARQEGQSFRDSNAAYRRAYFLTMCATRSREVWSKAYHASYDEAAHA